MAIEIAQVFQDFAVIMIVASVMTLISYKLKQPVIIGYIIAGMIIGPYTPPFSLILNIDILSLFAEIGVVLLLFVVGIEFPIQKLRDLGRKIIVIGIAEAFGTFAIGILVGLNVLQYSLADSMFLALAISVTSTVIIMRVLEEFGMIKEGTSHILLSVTVVEDITIISMLAVLQSAPSTGTPSYIEVLSSIGIVLAFIGGVLVIGSKTVPKFINFVGRTNQHDILIVSILGIMFGLSVIAHEIGISVATGAFFAGVLIAESKVHSVTKVLTTPIRDMFAALFFVSVGALMDISLIPVFIVPAVVLVLVSMASKFFIVFLASRSQQIDIVSSLKLGFGSASSGGELALVVAKGGVDVGATSSFILPMVGTMTIITTFIAPYLIKIGWKIANSFSKNSDNNNNNNQNAGE
jgi:CPA2 family monovalent cation:H+ antiporter-2